MKEKNTTVILILFLIALLALAGVFVVVGIDRSKENQSMSYEIRVPFDQWERFTSTELFEKGLGDYDYNTFEWKPLTDRLYAFDTEVFDISNMYGLFLQGVQAIADDLTITDVREDLSGMQMEMTEPEDPRELPTDGVRSVAFRCNGHEYAVTLTSLGDWFNSNEFLPFMNEVLEKEHCEKRLWGLYGGMDQMLVIVYGTEADARKILQ